VIELIELDKALALPEGSIDVLAIGESLVDMISDTYEDPLAQVAYRRYFGGSTGNVAINLAQLGFKVSIVSNVGADALGSFIMNTLRQEGVDISAVTTDHEHRTSLVVVNKLRNRISFSPYRDADMYIKLTDDVWKLAENAKILHFSTWPLSYSYTRDSMLELLRESKAMGKLLCFDPNYRRILWESGHDGVEFIKQIISLADIVKPSADDAWHLFGKDTRENYIERFLELGAGLVILTTGKDGAMVSNGNITRSYSSVAEEIIDTIGAGDGFWAGLYAGLLKGKTVSEAIRTGMKVSAYSLKTIGALGKLPSFEELEK